MEITVFDSFEEAEKQNAKNAGRCLVKNEWRS